MCFSWKRVFQNSLLIVVCGLTIFQTSVVAAENRLLPILGSHEAVAPYQEFSLLSNAINPPKVLAGSGQKERQPEIVQQLVQLANQWLDQAGQIEATMANSISETVPHLGQINLLLPIRPIADQLLFLQGGMQQQCDSRAINLGIGQRWFTAKADYWGYNLFYDQLYHSNHRRLGLGVEQHRGYRTLCFNTYLPLSRWQLVDNRNNRQRPAFGFDLHWQQQLARYPECCWRVVVEHYFADQLAVNEWQNKSPAKTAVSIGINYTPFSLLNLGYSYQLAKKQQGVHQFQLSLVYRLGIPLSQQLQSVRRLGESSDNYRLALVQREKSIKLQQVVINREQKQPELLLTNSFDETEEQADDEQPNAQYTLEQENPGSAQFQEISDGSQNAPTVLSEEIPADGAPSASPPGLSTGVSKFPGLVPGNSPPQGRIGGAQLQEISDSPQRASAVSSEEIAADDPLAVHSTNLLIELRNLRISQEERSVSSESESFNETTPRSCETPTITPVTPPKASKTQGVQKTKAFGSLDPGDVGNHHCLKRSTDDASFSAVNSSDASLEDKRLSTVTCSTQDSIELSGIQSETLSPLDTPTFGSDSSKINEENLTTQGQVLQTQQEELKAENLAVAAKKRGLNAIKEEQAGDEPPNAQPTSEQENPGGAQLQEISDSPQRASPVSSGLEFPRLVLGNSSPKGRTGKKKLGCSKSLNVKAAAHKAAPLLGSQEQRGVQRENAKENSAAFQPPIADGLLIKPRDLKISQEERSVSSESKSFNETTPRSYATLTLEIPLKESKTQGRQKTEVFGSLDPGDVSNHHCLKRSTDDASFSAVNSSDASLEDKRLSTVTCSTQDSIELSGIQSETRSLLDTPTFGSDSSKINEENLTTQGQVLQTQQEELKAENLAVAAVRQQLSIQLEAAKDYCVNVQNRLEAEKRALAVGQQQFCNDEEELRQRVEQFATETQEFSVQQNELEVERSALQNDRQTCYRYAEEQKQICAQLATGMRYLQIYQRELEAKNLAGASEFLQQQAQFVNFIRDLQTYQGELEAKNLAGASEFPQQQAQFVNFIRDLQTQQEKLAAKVVKQDKKITHLNRRRRLIAKKQGLKDTDKKTPFAVNKPELSSSREVNNGGGSTSTSALSAQPLQNLNSRESNELLVLESGDVSSRNIGNAVNAHIQPEAITNFLREINNSKRVGDSDAVNGPVSKERQLNEAENGSMSAVSNQPSASMDTGNAIDNQTQHKSHQSSEQEGDDQTQKQSAGTNLGESQASDQMVDESTTPSPSITSETVNQSLEQGVKINFRKRGLENSADPDKSEYEVKRRKVSGLVLKVGSESPMSTDSQAEKKSLLEQDAEDRIESPTPSSRSETSDLECSKWFEPSDRGEGYSYKRTSSSYSAIQSKVDEGNPSMLKISSDPSAATETERAANRQAQRESHQLSEQSGDDQIQQQLVIGNVASSSHSSYVNSSFEADLFKCDVRSHQDFEEKDINGDHSPNELSALVPNSISKVITGILEEKNSDNQQPKQLGNVSLDSISVEQSITMSSSNIQSAVDKGNTGENKVLTLPAAGKKRKLNETGNGSMSAFSNQPLASTDTGNVINIQTEKKSLLEQDAEDRIESPIPSSRGGTSDLEFSEFSKPSDQRDEYFDEQTSSHSAIQSEIGEGNPSMSKISNNLSALTETESAAGRQAPRENHQSSEQSSSEQAQAQTADVNSEKSLAGAQVSDEPATDSNKFILKINQLDKSEMEEFLKGKSFQFGPKSIEKIFNQRNKSVFIKDEDHFKQVVGPGQGTKILKNIIIDYTY